MKLKLIYGSDTGKTSYVVENYLIDLLDSFQLEVKEVNNISEQDWENDEFFMLGVPTWYDGVLQSDWEDYFEEFKKIDFTDKFVAIFGLGDQIGYAEYFVDGIGILAKVIIDNGGEIIGYWPTEGYSYDESKALLNDDFFYGVALDEDNEDDMTHYRLEKWVSKLKEEIEIITTTKNNQV